MNAIDLEKIKEQVSVIAGKYKLSLLVLFGSQASEKTHRKSDVDFGFIAHRKMSLKEIAEMQFDFSEKLKIKNLELVDLKTSPPFLLKNVAQNSVLLYQESLPIFDEFKIYGFKRFMEAKSLLAMRNVSLNKFLQKI